MPAAPANRENVRRAQALVTRDRWPNQRDAPIEIWISAEILKRLNWTISPAPYRETQKPQKNQRACWIPVAPAARNISAKCGGCRSEKRFKISRLRNPH